MHTLGINKYLLKIFSMMEACDEDIIPYVKKFQKRYLENKLPEYFYTSFPRIGEFKMENLKLFAFIANVILSDMKRW